MGSELATLKLVAQSRAEGKIPEVIVFIPAFPELLFHSRRVNKRRALVQISKAAGPKSLPSQQKGKRPSVLTLGSWLLPEQVAVSQL